MSDSERRVVGQPLSVTGGMTSTAEGIAELEKKRAEVERANRPEPTERFGAVLKRKQSSAEAAELTPKEEKLNRLPKQGPKPGLTHPGQKDLYGRDQSPGSVVLKG